MSIKLHDWLHRLRQDTEGGLSAEYVAILIVIGAIVAALWNANVHEKVETCGGQAADAVFQVESDGNPC